MRRVGGDSITFPRCASKVDTLSGLLWGDTAALLDSASGSWEVFEGRVALAKLSSLICFLEGLI